MGNSYKQTSESRIICFDYLRVVAVYFVIIIHLAAQNWYSADPQSTVWKIFNFYDSMARWAVPIYVMISGYLFLSREYEIRTIYLKYICRMIIVLVVWSSMYALFHGGNAKTIILRSISVAEVHLWFIPMIIGLYICLPFLKKIVESEVIMRYFLVVGFIFSFLLPWLVMNVEYFGGTLLKEVVYSLNKEIDNMKLSFVKGYHFYFILGYYLFKKELSKKNRYTIYGLGVVGFIATVFLTEFSSVRMATPIGDYYSYFSLNVLLESVAVFVWFRYHCYSFLNLNIFINKMAKYSFGAYLVHFLIIRCLEKAEITTMSFYQILSVPILSVIVFISSFLISVILNHIPYVKRYIV